MKHHDTPIPHIPLYPYYRALISPYRPSDINAPIRYHLTHLILSPLTLPLTLLSLTLPFSLSLDTLYSVYTYMYIKYIYLHIPYTVLLLLLCTFGLHIYLNNIGLHCCMPWRHPVIRTKGPQPLVRSRNPRTLYKGPRRDQWQGQYHIHINI